MATIGELAVNVVANTQKFVRNIRGARKEATGFKRTLANVSTGVFGFGKVLAGVAGAGAVVGFFNKTREQLDALGKTASKLGITTKALSELQFAGEQTGVEARTLGTALRVLVRRSSEAARGTGEAVKAFQELRINVRELVKLPLEKQLEVIADQLEKVERQSDRVRIMFKLVDSEGVGLANTFAGGSRQLKALRLEAIRAGRSFDDAGVRQIETMNDELNKAVSTVKGPLRQAFIELAPAITRSAERMSDFGVAVDTLLDPAKRLRKSQELEQNLVGFQLSPSIPRDVQRRTFERFGPGAFPTNVQTNTLGTAAQRGVNPRSEAVRDQAAVRTVDLLERINANFERSPVVRAADF